MDFIQLTIIDILDIIAIAVIMYYLYKVTRGTQAPSILTGVILIYILWIVVRALNMEMLSAILGHIIGVGVVALIVVFQPEIRRFLQMVGKKSKERRSTFLTRLFDFREEKDDEIEFVPAVVNAAIEMSDDKTGALIVIQQEMDLSMIVESGIVLDSQISVPLIKNLFFKNSPLHDGAVIIKDSRIWAAKCILPTTNSDVPVSFGMRHRAALGMSEETDSVVVVVSEETGAISLASGGQIKFGVSPNMLKEELLTRLETKEEESEVDEEKESKKESKKDSEEKRRKQEKGDKE